MHNWRVQQLRHSPWHPQRTESPAFSRGGALHWRTFASFIFWGIGDKRTGHCWLRLLGTRHFFQGKSNWTDSRCQLIDKLNFFPCLHFAFCQAVVQVWGRWWCTRFFLSKSNMSDRPVVNYWPTSKLDLALDAPHLACHTMFALGRLIPKHCRASQHHFIHSTVYSYIWVLPAQNLHVLTFRFEISLSSSSYPILDFSLLLIISQSTCLHCALLATRGLGATPRPF